MGAAAVAGGPVVVAAFPVAGTARHQRLDVPLPACLDRSGGPSSLSSAGPRRRPGTPGHPPGTPAQFPDPHSRGGTHRYPRPCVQEFHRKGKRGTMGKGWTATLTGVVGCDVTGRLPGCS